MARKILVDIQAVREEISNIQHQIWSHWMVYLFEVSIANEDGSYTIPPDKVVRWKNQLRTPYEELTEKEKESDREQAEKIISVLTKLKP